LIKLEHYVGSVRADVLCGRPPNYHARPASISLHGWGDAQWPINPPTTVLLSFTFIPPGTV